METSGRKFAWSVFVAILCVVMPAARLGAPRAVAAEPAEVAPCGTQAAGQWLRVSKLPAAKPFAKQRPCERRPLTT